MGKGSSTKRVLGGGKKNALQDGITIQIIPTYITSIVSLKVCEF